MQVIGGLILNLIARRANFISAPDEMHALEHVGYVDNIISILMCSVLPISTQVLMIWNLFMYRCTYMYNANGNHHGNYKYFKGNLILQFLHFDENLSIVRLST